MLRTLAGGLAAALMLVGCAETRASRTASEETLVTATATVESVDQATRQVVLRDDADGTTFAVTAGPEVRNLPQLAAGDRVRLDYYQSLAVAMADPADTGEPAAAVGAVRAPEGALPGGAAVATASMVVTLVNYDRDSGLASFRTPDGFTRRTVVRPDLRRFADRLTPGARVLVTMTEAVAVTITETAEPAAS
jgi:hypothetical protein